MQNVNNYNNNLNNTNVNLARKQKIEKEPFEKRFIEFRNNLEIRKVDWRDAHCDLIVNRESVLNQSLVKINKLDLFKVKINFIFLKKELKINFLGEVSNDAGGIIREWFSILIKELESDKLGK